MNTLEQADTNYYNERFGIPKQWASFKTTEINLQQYIIAAFKAGSQNEKDNYIDLLIEVESFIIHAKPEQWCIDHYKEKLSTLLKQLQD